MELFEEGGGIMAGAGNRSGAIGRLFVVSGPSGVGKGTLLKRLFSRVESIVTSVSATTRPPRHGERDGVNYQFYSREQFEQRAAEGYFLEFAEYGGHLYGTPIDAVHRQCEQGTDVILEIEVQGAMRVRELMPAAVLIYVKPPSRPELERRLRDRRTETEERILMRLATAEKEEACMPRYDYVVVNRDIEVASEVLCSIVEAERKHPR